MATEKMISRRDFLRLSALTAASAAFAACRVEPLPQETEAIVPEGNSSPTGQPEVQLLLRLKELRLLILPLTLTMV